MNAIHVPYAGQDVQQCTVDYTRQMISCAFRYDPQVNKWTKVACMSTRRLGVGVAVLGGYLYAVGGSDGTSPLNTGKGNIIHYIAFKVNVSLSSHHEDFRGPNK